MLDKFKFFNKDKDKKGASKGASKTPTHDLKSTGPREAGVTGGYGSVPTSPTVPRSSSSSKVGKKSRGLKDDGACEDNGRLASPSSGVYQCVPGAASPSTPALPTFSPGQTRRLASPSSSKVERGESQPSPKMTKKGSKLASLIPTKPTTSTSPSSPSSSSKSRAFNTGVAPPGTPPGQAPPAPTTPPPPLTSTGIPKPQSSKSGSKAPKEERSSRSKEYNKAYYQSGASPTQPSTPTVKPSSQHQQQHVPLTQQQLQRHQQHLQQLQLQQQKQQQQQQKHSRSRHHDSDQSQGGTLSSFSPHTPTRQDEPGYINVSQASEAITTSASLSRLPPSSSSQNIQGRARVNVQNMEVNGSGEGKLKTQSLERQVRERRRGSEDHRQHGISDYSLATPLHPHYVPVHIPPHNFEADARHHHPSTPALGSTSGSRTGQHPMTPVNSASHSQHPVSPSTTATVNIVKPTSHAKIMKTDSNTQTNLSVLKKSSSHRTPEGSAVQKFQNERRSPKQEQDGERASPKMHRHGDHASPKNDRSSPKRCQATETENREQPVPRSSPATVQASPVKPLASNFAAQMKQHLSSPTTTNSPRLGVKMLNSHHGKPAHNVAIVQPHHGEKVETTFDTEVRTETRPQTAKETTFAGNEEKTTFVDDTGEAMDIKPMQPIMRALPYGYFRGYTGYAGLSNNRNFHIPGISVPPASVYPARAQSQGYGVNRPAMESGKFHAGQMIQRANSTGASVSNDTDYSSDLDNYDYVSGYMSDGDILKGNSRSDDWSSGYLSEGGASLYARRLQQRFREGMQAVKECMQKSSGLIDDDSFDDSSSVSSGDISDTIAEISTDENLTGSSQGALSDSQVYNNLKRIPPEMTRGFMQHGQILQEGGTGKRAPNLGTSAFMGSDYYSDSGFGGTPSGWRKYSLPQHANKLLSSDPSDYSNPYALGAWTTRSDQQDYSVYRKLSSGSQPDQQDYGLYRKLSTASHPEFSPQGDSGYGDSERTFIRGEHASSPGPGSKRDCETNTDQSHLMDSNLRQRQAARAGNVHNGTPPSQGGGSMFGYRRPLSNTSNTSTSSLSSKGSGSQGKGSPVVGSRLARHGMEGGSQMVRSDSDSMAHMPAAVPRPASAASTRSCHSDMASEAYRTSTLERKERAGLPSSKSTGAAHSDLQSNSLGRRQLFSSKSSLAQHKSLDSAGGGEGGFPSPTYSKEGVMARNLSHYVNLQELHGRQQGNYVPLEFPSQRHSGGSATGVSLGASLWHRNSQSSIPCTAPDGEMHGSNLSLVSTSSSHSVYSSAEEKHAAEVRKLRRDLESAQIKVNSLTSQLSTNAHVVSAFEQSLANMTARLQALTSTSEQKDSELNDLRVTIEALRRQSGLVIKDPTVLSPASSRRHTSPAMVSKDLQSVVMESGVNIARQISSDSVSSINSLSSACSMTSQQSAATDGEGRRGSRAAKKKGWLRSSFSKAFSGKKPRKGKTGSFSDVEIDPRHFRVNASAPNSPLMQMGHMPGTLATLKSSHSSGALSDADVGVLKQQLREKDAKLTDIRLEALSSAHQLEQLRETMMKMKNEMSALKADNDRLHKLMCSSRSINYPPGSMSHSRAPSTDSLERSLSLTDQCSLDMLLAETAANDREGKRVTITVYQGSNPDPSRPGLEKPAEVLIGSLSVSGKTKWDILDNIVRKIFKEYVLRVDPVTNLGLSAESVFSYHLGEITRTKDSEVPELLPIGYLVGDTTQIGMCLKGTRQQSVDSLAFETMIPKSIIQRYVSLLLEHRRIILCGPSGTGKTYLAQKLAEHLVLRSGKELTAGSVAVFNVDHKSAKELRQYLTNIADQCESTSSCALPAVIILDNLHHVASLADVFNGFLTAKYHKCPYMIGTMNQSTCSTTNLQLHHNFRWVLCANHMEPVKGFLGRYLRRKLVEAEVRTCVRNNDLNRTIDWIPKVWAHVNKFLETHSSSDVTIGPRLFLPCPMDMTGSQVWFTDLWNYSIVPYIIQAVREGLQVYGKRAPWEDPTDWAMQTYPWSSLGCERQLLPIHSQDVGYDSLPPPSPPPSSSTDQGEMTGSNKKTVSPATKEDNIISTDTADASLVCVLNKRNEATEPTVTQDSNPDNIRHSQDTAVSPTHLPH